MLFVGRNWMSSGINYFLDIQQYSANGSSKPFQIPPCGKSCQTFIGGVGGSNFHSATTGDFFPCSFYLFFKDHVPSPSIQNPHLPFHLFTILPELLLGTTPELITAEPLPSCVWQASSLVQETGMGKISCLILQMVIACTWISIVYLTKERPLITQRLFPSD